jgi:hypothetical protein
MDNPSNTNISIFGQTVLGVGADSLHQVNIRVILSGKDIHLAALLIPGYKLDLDQTCHVMVGDKLILLKPLMDTHLHRS